MPRVDGLDRARGQIQFTADIELPGMLHTAVLRSPYARARVTGIDMDAARAARGVRAVLGPGELEVLKQEPSYVGEAVAAVAAETFGQAQAALRQLNAEWDVLEPLLDPDEAVRQESFVSDVKNYERGDFERGVAEGDVAVEAEYRTQVVLHNSMETHQAVCHWEDDGITVYISTQYIWGIRDSVAEHLGLPPDKVRVVCHAMGGGFGSKNSPGDYTPIAAELAKRTGRPVRCALTRREENLAAGNRNATIQRLTAAAKSDGTLTALGGEFVNAIGFSGWSASTEGPMKMLYACENVRTVQYPAKLNLPPMAAFRAPGFVEGTRAEPHWAKRDEVRARSSGPWKHGIGLASQIWYGGGGPPSYAWIRLGSDGRAQVVTAMQDIGTGTRTAMAQIAAEELGIPVEHVRVSLGDSARGPFASISAGSSTIPSMGPAVRSAAADAKRQLIEIAAQRFHLEERVLDIKNGQIVSSDGSSWPLTEITGLLEDGQILGKGARGPNPAGMQVLTFGVQVAEVAVDVETGEVRVDKIVAIHDVGRVINKLGASSQVEGGIIQGVGHTLSEERIVDPATGSILTRTLDAYKMPTIADVPEIVTELVDIPDPHLTNLGSKGLGEPPIIPTAAAIANAIRDATGADVRSLPISREEMLRALREAEAREKERRGAPAAV
ncbi:MAG: hypothetical protein AUG91_07535 [Actinobacteria bacterium 13_1_20CM_4_69_9]|nr:MAG: hypothetical protein AUG91_07535 [Actinobacteria bacterium 13_1_20CM_4_69_9]